MVKTKLSFVILSDMFQLLKQMLGYALIYLQWDLWLTHGTSNIFNLIPR